MGTISKGIKHLAPKAFRDKLAKYKQKHQSKAARSGRDVASTDSQSTVPRTDAAAAPATTHLDLGQRSVEPRQGEVLVNVQGKNYISRDVRGGIRAGKLPGVEAIKFYNTEQSVLPDDDLGDPITCREDAKKLPQILATGSNGCVQHCRVNGGIAVVKRSYCLMMKEDTYPIYTDANGIMREVYVLSGMRELLEEHPGYQHLVPFVGAGVLDSGEPVILLKPADESLEARLQRGSLSPREFIQCSRDTFAGLECMGTVKLVHQDVKPANVLLKEGRVWLADFGETTADKGIASLGVVGERWTAEQRIGGTKDIKPFHGGYELPQPATDVWSAGLTMISMLNPNQAEAFQEKLHKFPFDTKSSAELTRQEIEQLQEHVQDVIDDFVSHHLLPEHEPYGQAYSELFYRVFDPDPQTRITAIEARVALEMIAKKIVQE